MVLHPMNPDNVQGDDLQVYYHYSMRVKNKIW